MITVTMTKCLNSENMFDFHWSVIKISFVSQFNLNSVGEEGLFIFSAGWKLSRNVRMQL